MKFPHRKRSRRLRRLSASQDSASLESSSAKDKSASSSKSTTRRSTRRATTRRSGRLTRQSSRTRADITRRSTADTVDSSAADQADKITRVAKTTGLPEIPPQVTEKQQQFGHFTLLHELGRGAMGVVYLAWDQNLERKVALKLLPKSNAASEENLKRFQREARLMAQLSHENIVPVLSIGVYHNYHYYAMEYIEGKSLKQVMSTERISWQRASNIVMQVASGLAAAHELGIVHRDIKPDNIMITKTEEKCNAPDTKRSSKRYTRTLEYRDKAMLMDFGVALAQGEATLTKHGKIIGTPIYMSPEQAQGDRLITTPQSDIYSLGAVYYELITQHPPFKADNLYAILYEILHKDPLAPRKYVPFLDPDIEIIILKAMEKDPARRYATALEMAQDIERWLHQEPILARRAGPIYRLRKFINRNSILVLLCTYFAMFLCWLIVFFTYLQPWKQKIAQYQMVVEEHNRFCAMRQQFIAAAQKEFDKLYVAHTYKAITNLNKIEAIVTAFDKRYHQYQQEITKWQVPDRMKEPYHLLSQWHYFKAQVDRLKPRTSETKKRETNWKQELCTAYQLMPFSYLANQILLELGRVYYAQNKFDLTKSVCHKIIISPYKSPNVYFNALVYYGLSCFKTCQVKKALQVYQYALRELQTWKSKSKERLTRRQKRHFQHKFKSLIQWSRPFADKIEVSTVFRGGEFYLADIDSDGRQEIIQVQFGHRAHLAIYKLQRTPCGKSLECICQQILTGCSVHPGDFQKLVVGDLNNDGMAEMVLSVGNHRRRKAAVYIYTWEPQQGHLALQCSFDFLKKGWCTSGSVPGIVKLMDINADGHPDIVVNFSEYSYRTIAMINEGRQQFKVIALPNYNCALLDLDLHADQLLFSCFGTGDSTHTYKYGISLVDLKGRQLSKIGRQHTMLQMGRPQQSRFVDLDQDQVSEILVLNTNKMYPELVALSHSNQYKANTWQKDIRKYADPGLYLLRYQHHKWYLLDKYDIKYHWQHYKCFINYDINQDGIVDIILVRTPKYVNSQQKGLLFEIINWRRGRLQCVFEGIAEGRLIGIADLDGDGGAELCINDWHNGNLSIRSALLKNSPVHKQLQFGKMLSTQMHQRIRFRNAKLIVAKDLLDIEATRQSIQMLQELLHHKTSHITEIRALFLLANAYACNHQYKQALKVYDRILGRARCADDIWEALWYKYQVAMLAFDLPQVEHCLAQLNNMIYSPHDFRKQMLSREAAWFAEYHQRHDILADYPLEEKGIPNNAPFCFEFSLDKRQIRKMKISRTYSGYSQACLFFYYPGNTIEFRGKFQVQRMDYFGSRTDFFQFGIFSRNGGPKLTLILSSGVDSYTKLRSWGIGLNGVLNQIYQRIEPFDFQKTYSFSLLVIPLHNIWRFALKDSANNLLLSRQLCMPKLAAGKIYYLGVNQLNRLYSSLVETIVTFSDIEILCSHPKGGLVVASDKLVPLTFQANGYLAAGKIKQAIEYYNKALKSDPPDVLWNTWLYRAAAYLWLARQQPKQAQHWKQLARKDLVAIIKCKEAYKALVRAVNDAPYQNDRHDQSLEVLEELARLWARYKIKQTNLQHLWADYQRIYSTLWTQKPALDLFKCLAIAFKMEQLGATTSKINTIKYEVYKSIGMLDMAAKMLYKLPNSRQRFIKLIDKQVMKDSQVALEICIKTLAKCYTPEILYYKGAALRRLGRYPEALACFRQLRQDPNYHSFTKSFQKNIQYALRSTRVKIELVKEYLERRRDSSKER